MTKDNEANQFAMELLMPAKWLIKDCQGKTFDILDDKQIKQLAETYGVTIQMMTTRLIYLGILLKG